MAKDLSKRDAHRLMAHTLVDIKTLTKAYRGRPMRASAHVRIAQAARELRIPAPMPLVPAKLGRPPSKKTSSRPKRTRAA